MTIGSWLRLHDGRRFGIFGGLWLLITVLFGGMQVMEIGPIRLPSLAPLAMFIATIGGFIAEAFGRLDTNVQLPNPRHYAIARVAAMLSTLTLGAAAILLGAILRNSDPVAPVRNFILAFALFYWAQKFLPQIYWILPFLYLLISMYFGVGVHHTYWWALPLAKESSVTAMVVTAILALSAIIHLTIRPPQSSE